MPDGYNRPAHTTRPQRPPQVDQMDELTAKNNRPLRILLASYRSHPRAGGQGIYVHYLSQALANLGHQVDVISGPPYPDLAPHIGLIKLPSLDLHAVPNALKAFRWRFLTSFSDFYEWAAHNTGKFSEPYTFGRRLKNHIKTARPYDIIHDNQSLSWGVLALHRSGLPLVCTIHHPITRDLKIALEAEKSLFMRFFLRRWHSFLTMQKKVAAHLPHLITVSQNTRRDVSQDFFIDESQMDVIHNGVDTDVFRPHSDLPIADDTLLTTASADVPLKGLIYLLKAFALLASSRPTLKLVVIGQLRKGPTKKLLDDLGISDRVTFRSNLDTDELALAYAQASIVVCPSLYEGFGFPAAEAMACGTPVVSTTGGALPEVVGDAGLLVPPKDSCALAHAIATLLDSPSLRKSLGQKGRKRMLEKFSWRDAALSYETIYRSAIAHAHH